LESALVNGSSHLTHLQILDEARAAYEKAILKQCGLDALKRCGLDQIVGGDAIFPSSSESSGEESSDDQTPAAAAPAAAVAVQKNTKPANAAVSKSHVKLESHVKVEPDSPRRAKRAADLPRRDDVGAVSHVSQVKCEQAPVSQVNREKARNIAMLIRGLFRDLGGSVSTCSALLRTAAEDENCVFLKQLLECRPAAPASAAARPVSRNTSCDSDDVAPDSEPQGRNGPSVRSARPVRAGRGDVGWSDDDMQRRVEAECFAFTRPASHVTGTPLPPSL